MDLDHFQNEHLLQNFAVCASACAYRAHQSLIYGENVLMITFFYAAVAAVDKRMRHETSDFN